MPTFYFTYGNNNTQPYKGGWTEVIAKDLAKAIDLFCLAHPCTPSGSVNCAFFYTEEKFRETEMSKNGNMGRRCVETLFMVRRIHADDTAEVIE